MIELKNVTCRFGEAVAVDRINLTVETGEVCVLVGSSGCGKSTTLRMINRLLPLSAGEILVDGEDITTMNPEQLRLNMGYVIQGTGLFPHWTVARNIACVPRLLGWSDTDIEQAAAQVVGGACSNAGQVCNSVERVLVPEDIEDEVVAALVDAPEARLAQRLGPQFGSEVHRVDRGHAVGELPERRESPSGVEKRVIEVGLCTMIQGDCLFQELTPL